MRLVLDSSGQVWPDVLQKAPGRGAYLCMQPACLRRLSDKALQRAWREASIPAGEAEPLRERMRTQLLAMAEKLTGLQKARAAIGREAVIQRLRWSAPVFVMLAKDAGHALARQITAAMHRHGKAELITFPASEMLGQALGRGPVAVVAMEVTPMTEKIQRYCNWYIQFMESR